MTDDFSKPFRGVAWFGIWATDTADDYGKREALIVLRGAVECCMDDDMRDNREVAAALSYLARQATRNAPGPSGRRLTCITLRSAARPQRMPSTPCRTA